MSIIERIVMLVHASWHAEESPRQIGRQAGTKGPYSNRMYVPLIHVAGHDPVPIVGHVDQQAAEIHFRQLGRDLVFGEGTQ